MRFDPRPRVRRWCAAARGWWLYAVSVALGLIDVVPDVLNAVGGVDWSPLLPPGWGLRFGGWLAVARLVAPIVAAKIRQPRPPGPDPR